MAVMSDVDVDLRRARRWHHRLARGPLGEARHLPLFEFRHLNLDHRVGAIDDLLAHLDIGVILAIHVNVHVQDADRSELATRWILWAALGAALVFRALDAALPNASDEDKRDYRRDAEGKRRRRGVRCVRCVHDVRCGRAWFM